MPDKKADPTAAHQVELAIRQLDSLSTLPSVAAQFFPKLLQPQFSPSAIADIIESDPALTARILSLIHQQGVSLPDENFSLRRRLSNWPRTWSATQFYLLKFSGPSTMTTTESCSEKSLYNTLLQWPAVPKISPKSYRRKWIRGWLTVPGFCTI
jgi:predicted metalloendopeptidase